MTATKTRASAAEIGSVFEDERYRRAEAAVDRLHAHKAGVEKRQRANEEILAVRQASANRRAAALVAGEDYVRADALGALVSARQELAVEWADVERALAMAEAERDKVQQRVSADHCRALQDKVLDFNRRRVAAARAVVEIQREEWLWLEGLEAGGNNLNGLYRQRTLVKPEVLELAIMEFQEFYLGVEL